MKQICFYVVVVSRRYKHNPRDTKICSHLSNLSNRQTQGYLIYYRLPGFISECVNILKYAIKVMRFLIMLDRLDRNGSNIHLMKLCLLEDTPRSSYDRFIDH